MSRKPDPISRRSVRRRMHPPIEADLVRPGRKPSAEDERNDDSDFGLCLALAPALRRRGDDN